jgi:hypothetical protein
VTPGDRRRSPRAPRSASSPARLRGGAGAHGRRLGVAVPPDLARRLPARCCGRSGSRRCGGRLSKARPPSTRPLPDPPRIRGERLGRGEERAPARAGPSGGVTTWVVAAGDAAPRPEADTGAGKTTARWRAAPSTRRPSLVAGILLTSPRPAAWEMVGRAARRGRGGAEARCHGLLGRQAVDEGGSELATAARLQGLRARPAGERGAVEPRWRVCHHRLDAPAVPAAHEDAGGRDCRHDRGEARDPKRL